MEKNSTTTNITPEEFLALYKAASPEIQEKVRKVLIEAGLL